MLEPNHRARGWMCIGIVLILCLGALWTCRIIIRRPFAPDAYRVAAERGEPHPIIVPRRLQPSVQTARRWTICAWTRTLMIATGCALGAALALGKWRRSSPRVALAACVVSCYFGFVIFAMAYNVVVRDSWVDYWAMARHPLSSAKSVADLIGESGLRGGLWASLSFAPFQGITGAMLGAAIFAADRLGKPTPNNAPWAMTLLLPLLTGPACAVRYGLRRLCVAGLGQGLPTSWNLRQPHEGYAVWIWLGVCLLTLKFQGYRLLPPVRKQKGRAHLFGLENDGHAPVSGNGGQKNQKTDSAFTND